MLNLLTVTNIFYHLSEILFITKKVYHRATHYDLTGSVQIMSFFDKRCDDFEKYLLEKGYSEKMVRNYFKLDQFPEMQF